jgi:ABC-2 type transport system permease protein
MIGTGTVAWFARHETRLAWRDWAWLLSGGRRRRGVMVALGLLAFFAFMHGLAYLTLGHSANYFRRWPLMPKAPRGILI